MAFHILISPTFDENQTIMFFSLALKIAMVTSVLLFRVGFFPSFVRIYFLFEVVFPRHESAPERELSIPSCFVLQIGSEFRWPFVSFIFPDRERKWPQKPFEWKKRPARKRTTTKKRLVMYQKPQRQGESQLFRLLSHLKG